MKRISLAILALALATGLLAGCGAGALGRPEGGPPTAGFLETQKADGLAITLKIDEVKAGANHLVVNVDDPDVTAAEAQVIMTSMGHGRVVELEKKGPGLFEATTTALDMPGQWMLRVQAKAAAGTSSTAAFHLQVR